MFTGGRSSHSKRRNASGSSSGRKSSLEYKSTQPRQGPEGYTYRSAKICIKKINKLKYKLFNFYLLMIMIQNENSTASEFIRITTSECGKNVCL